MSVTYNPSLVLLALLIASIASWAMLETAGRVAEAASHRAARPWIGLGALVMGLGIWAMHFVAMLAMRLPIRLAYDEILTGVSILPAVASAAMSLRMVRLPAPGGLRLAGTSVLMGLGIASMHYLGMHAIEIAPAVRHDAGWVAASVVVAVLAAAGANLVASALPRRIGHPAGLRVVAAVVLGLAVTAMHFTGMAGARFDAASVCLTGASVVDELWLAQTVAMVVVSLAALSAVAAIGDARLSAQRQRRIEELEQAYRTLDVRARRIAMEMTAELAASEARYERALKASMDGVYDWDLATGKVHYSTAWRAMLGYGPNELPPGVEAWRELLHPEDREAAEAALQASLADPSRPYEAEFRMRTRDGDWRWMHARGAVERDPQGRPLRLSGSQRDVTTTKLAEAQLKRTLEQERELSGLRARLVSMASHEFRTPLTVIQSSSGLMRRFVERRAVDLPDAERLVGWCRRIEGATQQMVGMMETVLQMGRSANGGIVPKPVPLRLSALLREVVADAGELAAPRGQAIDLRIREDATLHADPVILRQVLGNLVSNALKFSDDGAPVTLAAEAGPEAVRFDVIDRGIGIPPEALPRMFEPFHRAANAGDRPGTGLGLALVHQLVEACGGRIELESEPGRGTTVHVTLPRQAAIDEPHSTEDVSTDTVAVHALHP